MSNLSRMFLRRGAGVLTAALALSFVAGSGSVAAATPGTETVWANGTEWTMLTPHAIADPSENLLQSAPPLYVLAFPKDPITGQWLVPSNYAPQCDPCLGVPVPPYHDHLLTGAPGFGTNGTAGDYEGPWRVVLMMYSPSFVTGGQFQPVTSDEDLPAAIAAGEFLPIGAAGGFEKPLPVVLICPLVSPNAIN